MRKKKKWLIISIQVVVILVITILIVAGISSTGSINARIAQLPAVSFSLMYGQNFNLQSVRPNTSVLIINFSPDCDHCQQQAISIREKEQELSNTSVIMITRADSTATRKFAGDYGLAGMKNVLFLQDRDDRFYKTFNMSAIPSIIIYNRRHELVKKIKGEVAMEYIVKLLNQ